MISYKNKYFEAMDEVAKERIKYFLLKEGTVKEEDLNGNVTISIVKHTNDERNYFKVSYPIYDENNNLIGTQTEYFDYSEDATPDNIDIYKKDLLCSEKGTVINPDQLVVQVNKGKQEYKVKVGDKNVEIESSQIEFTNNGYKIKDAIEKKTYYFVGPAGEEYKVVAESRYGQAPQYRCLLASTNASGWKNIEAIVDVDGTVIGIK